MARSCPKEIQEVHKVVEVTTAPTIPHPNLRVTLDIPFAQLCVTAFHTHTHSHSPLTPNPLRSIKHKTPLARNKIIPYRQDLKEKARRLRKESTYSEILFWQEIKNRKLLGFQFHRQIPMLDYILDFYCHELMLAIEIDGNSHESIKAQQYDKHRQSRLEQYGVRVLRFDDLRMKQDISKVVEEIKDWIEANGGSNLRCKF